MEKKKEKKNLSVLICFVSGIKDGRNKEDENSFSTLEKRGFFKVGGMTATRGEGLGVVWSIGDTWLVTKEESIVRCRFEGVATSK
jgi:saccharopine dehydrogenase-like NADP-dependent oxidoreductase